MRQIACTSDLHSFICCILHRSPWLSSLTCISGQLRSHRFVAASHLHIQIADMHVQNNDSLHKQYTYLYNSYLLRVIHCHVPLLLCQRRCAFSRASKGQRMQIMKTPEVVHPSLQAMPQTFRHVLPLFVREFSSQRCTLLVWVDVSFLALLASYSPRHPCDSSLYLVRTVPCLWAKSAGEKHLLEDWFPLPLEQVPRYSSTSTTLVPVQTSREMSSRSFFCFGGSGQQKEGCCVTIFSRPFEHNAEFSSSVSALSNTGTRMPVALTMRCTVCGHRLWHTCCHFSGTKYFLVTPPPLSQALPDCAWAAAGVRVHVGHLRMPADWKHWWGEFKRVSAPAELQEWQVQFCRGWRWLAAAKLRTGAAARFCRWDWRVQTCESSHVGDLYLQDDDGRFDHLVVRKNYRIGGSEGVRRAAAWRLQQCGRYTVLLCNEAVRENHWRRN